MVDHASVDVNPFIMDDSKSLRIEGSKNLLDLSQDDIDENLEEKPYEDLEVYMDQIEIVKYSPQKEKYSGYRNFSNLNAYMARKGSQS